MNITKEEITNHILTNGIPYLINEDTYWDSQELEYRTFGKDNYNIEKHFDSHNGDNCSLTPTNPRIEETTCHMQIRTESYGETSINWETYTIMQATGYACACGKYDNMGIYIHSDLMETITDITAEKLGIERKILP